MGGSSDPRDSEIQIYELRVSFSERHIKIRHIDTSCFARRTKWTQACDLDVLGWNNRRVMKNVEIKDPRLPTHNVDKDCYGLRIFVWECHF